MPSKCGELSQVGADFFLPPALSAAYPRCSSSCSTSGQSVRASFDLLNSLPATLFCHLSGSIYTSPPSLFALSIYTYLLSIPLSSPFPPLSHRSLSFPPTWYTKDMFRYISILSATLCDLLFHFLTTRVKALQPPQS